MQQQGQDQQQQHLQVKQKALVSLGLLLLLLMLMLPLAVRASRVQGLAPKQQGRQALLQPLLPQSSQACVRVCTCKTCKA